MPLSNDEIIAALVRYYRRTGVDMTSLLGDPTFQAMGVADKIEYIKKYAKEIHENSSNAYTTGEKKQAVSTALMNAWPVIPGILAVGLKSRIPGLLPGIHGSTLFKVGLAGAVAGIGLGAMQSAIQARHSHDSRVMLRANLAQVARAPTTENALGVISTDNINRQGFSLKNAILGRIQHELGKMDPGEFVKDSYKEFLPIYNDYAGLERDIPTQPIVFPTDFYKKKT